MKIGDMDLSPELRGKAMACKSPEELLALAKAEGYKLSEEELGAIAGGGGWSYDNPCPGKLGTNY
jgi:predicted ribosomally synthesized peptide with nif11-like leader